eukprot:Skav227096  [mRNA]  locus=scaffold199:6515:11398:+ [translate_table: standard]
MATPLEIFTDLCTRFKIHEAIRDQIIKLGITSLSEFRYYVSAIDELEGAFVNPVKDKLENAPLQLSRVRHCWTATCVAESSRDDRGSAAPLQLDGEALLPSAQLTNIRDVFWARYKLVFPPDYTPSDRMLTKAQRALAKRSLEVIDMWQVRSISSQRLAVRKKRKVGHGLYVADEGDEVDEGGVQDWVNYLLQMRLYLLSLVMAGATKIEPQPSEAETATSDSTKYVLVPYDVAMRYFCRAEMFALKLSERTRLARLAQLDRQERSEWAHRLANSAKTLGEIIQEIYRERDGHWVPPVLPSHPVGPPPAESSSVRGNPRAEPAQSRAPAREFADALRDGTPLCKAWQTGKCNKQRDARCPNGLHRCAIQFATGRELPRVLTTLPGESPADLFHPQVSPGGQSGIQSFDQAVAALEKVWADFRVTDDDLPQVPVFLDLLSGERCPLSYAFKWAGWNVLHPVDFALDQSLDLTAKSVQVEIANVLPTCHLVSCAIDCSTKSRIREIPLSGKSAPRPLRTEAHPRGLPGLDSHNKHRIQQDNQCSDFVLAAVQHLMQSHGRAAFRENPRNSLHWFDDVECWLESQGVWYDWLYDACCLFASRRKKQRIRHCVPHMRSLPTLTCAHIHDPGEWAPSYNADGSRFFPSKEEAEYTAHLCFTLVVACSHWAVDQGLAVMRIQRMPPMQCSGDWRHLLDFPPSMLRSEAMPAVAAYLGLLVCRDSPRRLPVSEVWSPGEPLPDHSIYIGHGHFRHRFPTTQWENPFFEGRDGTPQDVVLKYARWLPNSPLAPFVHELAGKQLLCDCAPNQFCHGDVLVGEFNQIRSAPVHMPRVRRRHGRILLGMTAGFRIPAAVAQPLTQAHVVTSVKNLTPGIDWTGCKWPLIEDLVNHTALIGFQHWMHDSYPDMDHEYGPLVLAHQGVLLQRAGAQAQGGGASMKASLAPLVSFGLDKDTHFQQALKLCDTGSPLDWPGLVDHDLQYAAAHVALGPEVVSSTRRGHMRVFMELSARLRPVTHHIFDQLHADIRSVNPSVHLALLAVLLVLFAWPDVTLVSQLCHGFPAVGWIPPCGLWAPKPAEFQTLDDALRHGIDDSVQLMASMSENEHDAFACEAGEDDEAHGFCTPEFGLSWLHSQGRPYRLIKRFVISQSSGKLRVIDDACAGLQSKHSSDANQLRFCSAVQPCFHIQALQSALRVHPSCWPDDLLSFGEDLPQAYRKIPMDPSHTWSCVVAYRRPGSSHVCLRRYYSMLFGLPLAVTAFNRLAFFLQACVRRVGLALSSFYFDDMSAQDWSSSSAACQTNVQQICQEVGFPFALEKQQLPSPVSDFLGLNHDLSSIRSKGVIQLWPRDRLLDKISGLIAEAKARQQLTPGEASKLYGCLTFMDQGAFGRVARAGLNDLKDRQYSSSKDLSASLLQTFDLVQALLQVKPRREVLLDPLATPRLIVASDASQDQPRQGKAGVLLVAPTAGRVGAFFVPTEAVFNLWNAHPVKIAQLELLAVLHGLLAFADHFRSSKVVWFVDNVAALMSLFKGRSDNPELDFMAQAVHLLMFHLRCFSFFEWIPSASNWSDGISRDDFRDDWLNSHQFRVHQSSVPVLLWRFDFLTLSCIFSFL